MPVFYNKNMYKKDLPKNAKYPKGVNPGNDNIRWLKLYQNNDWVWIPVRLRKTDIDYINKYLSLIHIYPPVSNPRSFHNSIPSPNPASPLPATQNLSSSIKTPPFFGFVLICWILYQVKHFLPNMCIRDSVIIVNLTWLKSRASSNVSCLLYLFNR